MLAEIINITTIMVVFIVWAELMFYLAEKDKPIWFSIVFIMGFIPAIIGLLSTLPFNALTILFTTFGSLIYFIIGYLLYEQAGNKLRRWFYLTLLFPILGFVYVFTKK